MDIKGKARIGHSKNESVSRVKGDLRVNEGYVNVPEERYESITSLLRSMDGWEKIHVNGCK